MGFAAYWSRGRLIPVLLGAATLILLLCAGKLRFSRDWYAVGQIVGNLDMRQEIHYALTLTHWLVLEGGRRDSVEEFWSDLVFAAQRLGDCSVRLALADGQRRWDQTNACGSAHSVVQVLQAGRLGTLELKAPAGEIGTLPHQRTQPCERSFRPRVSDERVFEIVSELLAEGWVKGVSKSSGAVAGPLRFDTKLVRQQ